MHVLKLGRKVLTIGTVFSTILWSVGVSALVPAMVQAADACPAFKSGDMIKVTGRPAIYSVDSNGKVLYFPSGDEFKSWNSNDSYGGYISVTQSCFDSLPVPTTAPLGVNFRPGSYVVKRPSSDQLYVVEPGNMLATITPAAAAALYGAAYKVITVADVFWPNYGNTRGAAITDGSKAHPGMLISNGGKTYLVNADSSLSEVTASGFTANRFKAAFVRPVSSVAGYVVGSQITDVAAAVADRSQTGGSTSVITPPAQTGGALSVALASDNPAGQILASGTAFNPVLKVTLTAGSADVSVTGLTVRKTGLAANTSVSGADVIDSAGVRHGNVASTLTSDNDLQLYFTSSPIVVKAGTSQTVTVRVNLASGALTGTLQFSLLGASSVTSGATASGSFPITGNTFTLQDGSNAIGGLTVTAQLVGTSTLNIDSANQQDITKFRITETSSKENVSLTGITLYNNGTAADTDVADVQIVAQDGTVLGTAQQVSKNVVFTFATPYVLDKGTSKDFTVRAKLVNGAGRTVNFVVYNNYDVAVKGASSGAFLLSSSTFPVGSGFNTMTMGSGTLSFNKDTSSRSTAVTPGSNGVELAKFYIKPMGEDMELRKITLSVVSSSAVLTGSLTVKVNGSAVWSTDGTGFGSVSNQTLSTYPTLTAGQNSYITVEGNIMSGASNSATITVSLQPTQVRRLITNDIHTPSVNSASGNQLVIQAGALQVTNLSTPVAQSLVAGSTGVELAKFEFNPGVVSSGEDVKVSKIIVSDSTSTPGGALTDIGNLALYDANGNQIQTTNSTATNAASTTFTFANQITISQTGSTVLTLKGDVLTGSAGAHVFSIANGSDVTAVGVTTGNTINATKIGSGQAMSVTTAGSLTLSTVTGDGAAPASDQTVAVGTTNVPVFAMKLTAQREAMKITRLVLTASGTLATSNDVVNVKLYNDAGTQVGSAAAQGVLGSNVLAFTWTAADNLLPAAIQPGTPVTLYAKADISGGGTAKLGDSFRFYIASTTTDVVAKGVASATGTVTGSPAVTALTYLTPFSVAVAADYPTTPVSTNLVNGSRIGTFKITNNGSSQVTITGVTLTNSGSSATYQLAYSSQNSSDYTANVVATSTGLTFTPSFTIDGGAYRYVTVSLASAPTSGDSWQLSVASLGNITYTATGAALGYAPNADGDLTATSASLKADGKPSLSTISDSN